MPKSTPQDCSVKFESKENSSPSNESSVIKGNRSYYGNAPTICTSNRIIPRVSNNSSYDINRAQQQNILRNFHPQTDIDKPATTNSLYTNSCDEDMASLRSSEDFLSDSKEKKSLYNFNREKYTSRQDYEYEHIPVVEETLNSSEDETYEGWYKKLDTPNTRDSLVSKTQINDCVTNHSITEKVINDRDIHSRDYNYTTYSESQFSSQLNNLQPVTPKSFSIRNYSFKQNTANLKNTLQSNISNDPNKHMFEINNRQVSTHENHHYKTFIPSTLQYSEKYINPGSVDFTQNRPAYKENSKRTAPQTETFKHSNKKIITNNIRHFDKMKKISVCENNQWAVPEICTNVQTSPGNSEKIILLKPNDPESIISYIDLTEDLKKIEWEENDFNRVDFINKEASESDETSTNNLDLSNNVRDCEKGINNLSANINKVEKKQTMKNNACNKQITNANGQTSSIDFKQNKTMIENPIKTTERKKTVCRILPVCEVVNSSDDEINAAENLIQHENKKQIITENVILPEKNSKSIAENSIQSKYDVCEIVTMNLLNKFQRYQPGTSSPNFSQSSNQSKQNSVQNVLKCDKSVQQNNSTEYYYKPVNINIQCDQIHITNNFQKLNCIIFNAVPRPFNLVAYQRRYKGRKLKSVTWRAPLVLLSPRASNTIPGNNINDSQIEEFSMAKKNLSLTGRNHQNKLNIATKRPAMSVMKSVMQSPLKKLLSLCSFNTTANNIIEISVNGSMGKRICKSSQDKIRELKDNQEDNIVYQEKDKPMSPLQKDQHEPIIEQSNDVNTLKKIAEKRVSQINESNMTDAVDITREVSPSLKRTREVIFAEPSKKICNKEIYVKEWLKKSPFNCFPNLDPDKNVSQTGCQEIEINEHSEKTMEIAKAIVNENTCTTMITSSLLKYKQKQDSGKIVDKKNDCDGFV